MNAGTFLPSAPIASINTHQCPAVRLGPDPLGTYRGLRWKLASQVLLLLTMMAWAVSVPPAQSQSANDGFDPNVDGMVWALALQADGRILIGGEFTLVGGTPHSDIARLNVDGSVDPSFNLGANGIVRTVAVQADRKILVGGSFTMLGGQARTNIGRFHADGTLDTTFNPGAAAGSFGTVYSLAVQADGKIVVGGYYGPVQSRAVASWSAPVLWRFGPRRPKAAEGRRSPRRWRVQGSPRLRADR